MEEVLTSDEFLKDIPQNDDIYQDDEAPTPEEDAKEVINVIRNNNLKTYIRTQQQASRVAMGVLRQFSVRITKGPKLTFFN